jgi:dTDP-4-dehydrorhamnose 3,5-epimerase
MKFTQQKIDGLFLINPNPYEDERGVFHRSYCEEELRSIGIDFSVKQGNISENFKKYTLRGFHYQKSPSKESKIISCLSGSIFNVVIDLRAGSDTIYHSVSINISAKMKQSILIPAGCANAFLTTKDDTLVHYYMSDYFSNDTYSGIRYDDPMFSIEWPHSPVVISDKDLNFPNYLRN